MYNFYNYLLIKLFNNPAGPFNIKDIIIIFDIFRLLIKTFHLLKFKKQN